MILDDALAHLAAAPGKRLRPRLLEAAAVACGCTDTADAAASAEAVELIHTYSLVHDDLPAMDDDALRRGQATLHVAFDEATAILVGDGLQTRAFELIANDARLSAEQRVALISVLARASGFEGMVGGQSRDMQATDRALGLEELKAIHAMKTGALITAALEMGAIVADATAARRETLRAVGDRIGLAFQIIDDVLDVRSDSATLGKTTGKDAATNKSTYVAHLGLDAAEAEADRLYEEALALIVDWDARASGLRELLAKMVKRDR
ncbi:MAG: farnesyl diphosphate synthase [Halieaceae bacterium]|jgi:geranylgeranyl pyrophosphate synthase|nr:farnesyl diphosphate synthase [Halieaceae bacterium]